MMRTYFSTTIPKLQACHTNFISLIIFMLQADLFGYWRSKPNLSKNYSNKTTQLEILQHVANYLHGKKTSTLYS